MIEKPKIYIAGPYSGGDVAENVRRAMSLWHELRDYGFSPYCPHLSHFLHMHELRPYEEWLEYDLEWLKSCDVLYRFEGPSSGADAEIVVARELNIHVYYEKNGSIPDSLFEWLNKWNKGEE